MHGETIRRLMPLAAVLSLVAVAAQSQVLVEGGAPLIFAQPGNGTRTYAVTERSDFARESFRAEVTATIKGGGGAGCAFFGIGKGMADPAKFAEPSAAPSLYLRVAPSDFSGGIASVSANALETLGSDALGDGTHRLRLTWDAAGHRALFEIARNGGRASPFKADASYVVPAAGIDFGHDARLFVGGASGVVFSDFSANALTVDEVKAVAFPETFVNDPTARTWLPAGLATNATRTSADALLKPLAARMRLLACWYNGSQLAAARTCSNGTLKTAASRWSCDIKESPVAGEPDARDYLLTFKLEEGRAMAAGVAVALDFEQWSTSNHVLIPASVYNGNRNKIEHRGYCTGFDAGDFYNKDIPQITTDLPQLSPEAGKPSKLEVSACNATTPAICLFSPERKRGFMVLTSQGMPLKGDAHGTILDNGFSVEESADRLHATLVVSAPGVRERMPRFIGFGGSPDRGIDWKPGDTATIRLRLYSFATPDIPGLLEKFMAVRKAVTGPNHPRNLLPFSEVTRLMTARIDSRFTTRGTHQYYCPENSDNLCIGWIGGLIDTFPMLVLGDETHRDRVTKTFDFVMPAAVGRTGFFLATVHPDGKAAGRDWFPNQPIVLTRQPADVLFWMTKQFMLLKAQGHADAIKPEWQASVRKLAQAFVNTWKRHGQWGNYVNHETGDIAIYNSTSGAIAIGGLALASRWFDEPEFLAVARDAAAYYYREDFVRKGFTYGACSDIMQNADSETAAALMTGLMALYEVTGDAAWLEKSRNVANLVATWTVSYDYELPTNTELGGLGAKLAGAYWASTQNKHGAPGICTSSGDPLFKIFRATGDRRYADLMRDIVHAHAEGIRPGGEITERLTYCDADSRGSRTAWGGSVGWNEVNGILMAMELPGVYVRVDTGDVFVFDHVEARVVGRDARGVTLAIANPTKYDAKVSLFAESRKQAGRPLGCTAFLNWPQVDVKAGGTVSVRIASDGSVRSATGE